MTTTHHPDTTIEADPAVPLIRMTRDFAATPAQLLAAHLDPELFVQWVGPDAMVTRTLVWDVRDGGDSAERSRTRRTRALWPDTP